MGRSPARTPGRDLLSHLPMPRTCPAPPLWPLREALLPALPAGVRAPAERTCRHRPDRALTLPVRPANHIRPLCSLTPLERYGPRTRHVKSRPVPVGDQAVGRAFSFRLWMTSSTIP